MPLMLRTKSKSFCVFLEDRRGASAAGQHQENGERRKDGLPEDAADVND
jgi:hypothetical protein